MNFKKKFIDLKINYSIPNLNISFMMSYLQNQKSSADSCSGHFAEFHRSVAGQPAGRSSN